MDDRLDDLVSVIVPTRDRVAFLARAVAGILCQSHRRIEVLVVDDGSEDETADYLAAITDPRLHTLRHDRPKGVSATRNRGLASATGEWVAFIDDDDLWAPDKLTRQLHAVNQVPGAGWSCTSAVLIDTRLRLLGWQRAPGTSYLADVVLACNPIPGGASTVMARRRLIVDAGGFDERLSTLADWDLWTRLALASPLAPVDRAETAYTLQPGGLSADTNSAAAERAIVVDRYSRERRRRDVDFNEVAWNAYLADRDQRTGARLRAAKGYAHAARKNRRLRTLASALAAFVWPSSVVIRDRWHRRRIPLAERRSAEHWIDSYRTGRRR
jgi:glycosyltransferase involved in cell wall biosynthesis